MSTGGVGGIYINIYFVGVEGSNRGKWQARGGHSFVAQLPIVILTLTTHPFRDGAQSLLLILRTPTVGRCFHIIHGNVSLY